MEEKEKREDVDEWILLANHYSIHHDPQTALIYAQKAFDKGERLCSTGLLALCYMNMGDENKMNYYAEIAIDTGDNSPFLNAFLDIMISYHMQTKTYDKLLTYLGYSVVRFPGNEKHFALWNAMTKKQITQDNTTTQNQFCKCM